MFENAIEIVQGYTRPVISISRSFGSENIKQESTTIFFVNEFGIAITTAEVILRLFPPQPYDVRYREFKEQRDTPGSDVEKLMADFGYNHSDAIADLKTMFLNCAATLNKVSAFLHPKYNFGILYLEDVADFQYTGYAVFDTSSVNLKKGRELMRLGYPFPQSANFKYDRENEQLEWDMDKQFVIDSFPVRGLVTRHFFDGGRVVQLEMDTPGFKGHEGSPLFNQNGHVCGIHFDNVTADENDPHAVFGNCFAANVITEFLSENGVKYYKVEDGKEVVCNEKSKGIQVKQLVPTYFIGGSDESSMHVFETKLVIGDSVVVDYKEPFQLAVTKMDNNSRKDGSATVQFSIDGRNNVFIIEENAGNVRHLQKDNNFELQVIKKECRSQKFKVKASIKTQSYFPFSYFDFLVIRRYAERDHVNDPHIAFYPDASGKYIRYSNNETIRVVTSKIIEDRQRGIIPLQSRILTDEFEIEITYIVNAYTLAIGDFSIVDKIASE